MNLKSLLAALLVGGVVTGAVLTTPPSNGQAAALAAGDDPALTTFLNDVTAQQASIADNQAKIDAKLAAIGENIRQARIYVGRGGGKTK